MGDRPLIPPSQRMLEDMRSAYLSPGTQRASRELRSANFLNVGQDRHLSKSRFSTPHLELPIDDFSWLQVYAAVMRTRL